MPFMVLAWSLEEVAADVVEPVLPETVTVAPGVLTGGMVTTSTVALPVGITVVGMGVGRIIVGVGVLSPQALTSKASKLPVANNKPLMDKARARGFLFAIGIG
jgi:hypothetical protein